MSNTDLKVIKLPTKELTVIGKKAVSIFGWRHDLAEEHLKWHLSQRTNAWCSVECMARTLFQRNTPTNREGVRKRMGRLFRVLLERGLFLVIEYDFSAEGHGKIMACKLFEKAAGAETQHAIEQIERMRKRKMISDELWQRAINLLDVKTTET